MTEQRSTLLTLETQPCSLGAYYRVSGRFVLYEQELVKVEVESLSMTTSYMLLLMANMQQY